MCLAVYIVCVALTASVVSDGIALPMPVRMVA